MKFVLKNFVLLPATGIVQPQISCFDKYFLKISISNIHSDISPNRYDKLHHFTLSSPPHERILEYFSHPEVLFYIISTHNFKKLLSMQNVPYQTTNEDCILFEFQKGRNISFKMAQLSAHRSVSAQITLESFRWTFASLYWRERIFRGWSNVFRLSRTKRWSSKKFSRRPAKLLPRSSICWSPTRRLPHTQTCIWLDIGQKRVHLSPNSWRTALRIQRKTRNMSGQPLLMVMQQWNCMFSKLTKTQQSSADIYPSLTEKTDIAVTTAVHIHTAKRVDVDHPAMIDTSTNKIERTSADFTQINEFFLEEQRGCEAEDDIILESIFSLYHWHDKRMRWFHCNQNPF